MHPSSQQTHRFLWINNVREPCNSYKLVLNINAFDTTLVGLWTFVFLKFSAIACMLYYWVSRIPSVHCFLWKLSKISAQCDTQPAWVRIAIEFSLSFPLFAGYVRDYTQSYSACLSTVGTVQLIAALLWLLLPKAQKWQDSQVRRESAKFVRRHSTTPPAATSSQPATLRRHSSISSVELALHRWE